MPKSYSNLDPEESLERVRKHFATTSPQEVVRRAEKLTPQKGLGQRKIKKQKGTV